MWSLVLSAVGIPHVIRQPGEEWILLVPEKLHDEAVRQIELFQLENKNREEEIQAPKSRPLRYTRTAIWTVLLVSAVMSATFRYEIRQEVLEVGTAYSDAILRGQWWRVITALFIHEDPSHFLSNMMIGGFIIFWLIEETSPGTGWFLTLVTGAAGNYLNALAHGYDGHLSIGASTAVFGALGTLFAIRAVKTGKKGLLRETLCALASGLALLAMLGAGGKNVDLGAHLFGYISGLFCGAVSELVFRQRMQYAGRFLGPAALLIVGIAWISAVKHMH